MGSVMPLIAIKDDLRSKEAEFLWLGTKNGPERRVVEKAGVKFQDISSAKLRRYFSWKTLAAPFLFAAGFFQSLLVILKFKPDLILTAGGFVCVPVAFAGFVLRKRIIVHQQDLTVGLANKLMAPLASIITVSLEILKKEFSEKKTIVIGNPVRKNIFSGSRDSAAERFGLENGLPVVLVLGGGTGSTAINNIINQTLPELVEFCQVIHVTGPGKNIDFKSQRYHSFEFLNEDLADAYAVADLVISRAGFGALTELSALGKPAILIPLPNKDQIKNSEYFLKHEAAEVLTERDLTVRKLKEEIKALIENDPERQKLSKNIGEILSKNANASYQAIIEKVTKTAQKH